MPKGFQPGDVGNPAGGPGQFEKGKSGNPGGRTKEQREKEAKLKAICTKHGPRIIAFYMEILEDSEKDTSDRITAGRLILEYGYGKPKQQTEVTGEDGGPVVIKVTVNQTKD